MLNSGVLRSGFQVFSPSLLSALGGFRQTTSNDGSTAAWVGLNPEMPNLEVLSFELKDGVHRSLERALASPWPAV